MRKRYIWFVTGIGLLAILLLQSIWLYSTYLLLQDDLKKKSDLVLQEVVNIEIIGRLQKLESSQDKPVKIMGGALMKDGKVANQYLYFQEALIDLDYPVSLPQLDSIYVSKFKELNIATDLTINYIKVGDGSIIQSTGGKAHSSIGTIKTEIVPIRQDGSEGIQAILVNPYWAIFERMGLLLIATVLMMLFVVGCIVYQIRIIVKQRKIAKMREDFSYAMIHDMKTPLTSIQMGTRILHSGKLDDKPEKKERHFNIIEDEAQHLLMLANKVLTISKMETGKLELTKAKFVVSPLLLDMKNMFTAKAQKPVTFSIDIQEEMVYGDKEYLKECISNLIDNAIKYSGSAVHIDLSVRSANSFVLISVKDNGFGISHQDQKIIFEKFERASAVGRSRKGGATGFGLGLNFVQGIVEAHNGKVQLDSIEGEFSEFTIYIPQIIEVL